jgi:hypothetical protein
VVYEGCKAIKLPTDSDWAGVNTNECQIQVNIDRDVDEPVFIYYQLENFYQNHRRYVKSRSNKQLLGEVPELPINQDEIEDVLSDCAPIYTNKDAERTVAADGVTVLDPNAAAHPCGLVAKSFFNDTYTLYTDSPTPQLVELDESDIAWKSDVDNKFFN